LLHYNLTLQAMAATQRRRSLHLDLSDSSADVRPPLAALFLIQFDVKAGYTIAWKRAAPGLELSDSVEFKSLPSGLHNVPEDLVYFMHGEDYAGISAFINTSRSAMRSCSPSVPWCHSSTAAWAGAGSTRQR
jgi:hypothetical protein